MSDRLAIVHPCCGCSCHVCKDGHAGGSHTDACWERLYAEQESMTGECCECGRTVMASRMDGHGRCAFCAPLSGDIGS